jgi:uncharacterized protein (TIGR01777 family)
MHIFITGGTGFIGQPLCRSLLTEGVQLTVLTRNIQKAKHLLPDAVHFIEHLAEIKPETKFDAVINLAGAPIAKRWSTKYKSCLLQSRVAFTRALVQTLSSLAYLPKVLLSGSAIGYYGPQLNNALSESAAVMPSFSHDLCQAWEAEAYQATKLGIRVCTLRTGIVLGPRGGALARMRLPFLMGLGEPIGSGEQWMSWVHLDDMVRIIRFCLEQKIEGPVNATSPQPVTNKDFAEIYAKVLHRPAIMPMPAFLLRILLGQMAEELLLTGQRVIPTKLQQQNFEFQYPTLLEALSNIEKKTN